MKIEEFNKKFVKKINSFEKVWNKDGRILHLGEEVGEFMEIIMQYKGLKKPKKNKDDIANALADILDDVFALAYLYKIDFKDIFKKVLK